MVNRGGIQHIMVVFDDSPASRRALQDAAAIADEHDARLSVVTLVNYERRTRGCCLRSGYWNEVLDEVALGELASARAVLGERDLPPRFDILPGAGSSGVRRAASQLGCDLVLVPVRGLLGRLTVRRLRRRVPAEVLGVRAA